MKLSEKDKKMLNGEYGEAKKIAMEKILKYAKIVGAEELCDVTKSTAACDCMDEFLLEGNTLDAVLSKSYLGKEMELDTLVDDNCLFQDDVCCIDGEDYENCNQTKEFFEENMRFLNRACQLGTIRASTCAPYLTGWIPLMGEVFLTTESSNYSVTRFGAPEEMAEDREPPFGQPSQAERLNLVCISMRTESAHMYFTLIAGQIQERIGIYWVM